MLGNIVMSLRDPHPRAHGFYDRPRAMMGALELPRLALQPLGCHHGPWAVGKTHDPSGWGVHNVSTLHCLLTGLCYTRRNKQPT
jgi:hypothetical protein